MKKSCGVISENVTLYNNDYILNRKRQCSVRVESTSFSFSRIIIIFIHIFVRKIWFATWATGNYWMTLAFLLCGFLKMNNAFELTSLSILLKLPARPYQGTKVQFSSLEHKTKLRNYCCSSNSNAYGKIYRQFSFSFCDFFVF